MSRSIIHEVLQTLREGLEDSSERRKIVSRWRELTNMSAAELRAWKRSPISKMASIDPAAVIDRNLRLLETPVEKWNTRDYSDARRTISFNSRMKEAEQGEDVRKEIPFSKRDISLLNWAYRPASVSAEKFAGWTSEAGIEKAQTILSRRKKPS